MILHSRACRLNKLLLLLLMLWLLLVLQRFPHGAGLSCQRRVHVERDG